MKRTGFDYKLFFDLSPDLLCIAGFDGYFKKVNPAVSKLLGYSKEELYARPINDFVYPEDREITSTARENLTKSKPLHYFENRYVTKSGEIVWLSWTSQPVAKKKLVFAIAKDVTHKKRLEIERTALLDNLTRANNELKELSLTTSHDLRSPLSSILGVFELLDISKITDQETLDLIEILKLTGTNLNKTLNNFVDVLSEKMGEPAKLEEVDFEESLNETLLSIRSLIKTTKTTLYSDFSKLKKIRFNKAYMESIFMNLITNAVKYSKPDTSPVISIHSEESDGVKRLIVTDNGLGFDMESTKERIFGMHQTFHNNEDSKGIGLYLVYNQVVSLGGEISVESKVNEGTTFTITFRE